MEALELLDVIQRGESSSVQFKVRIDDAHKLSQELVAFSNSNGGILIIGVDDKTGALSGLSFDEIQKTNRLIVDATTNNVKPSIVVETQTIEVDSHNIIILTIEEGLSKPYKDKNGAIWIKNGSDKRRVTSNEEISRLLQSSKVIYADEMPIQNTSPNDIDIDYYKKFIQKRSNKSFEDLNIDIRQSLENLNLLIDNKLTLAGLLIFCPNREKYRPLFSIQCVKVNGTTLTGNDYSDNEPPFDGNLETVYEKSIAFIERNIHKIQSGTSFNSPSVWEIPYEVFEELIVNALLHREYFINSTVKLFIFSDRIEIVSPGKLPNSLNEEKIKNGLTNHRNPTLVSFARDILPYKGLGTGINRALAAYSAIEFVNEQDNDRFIVRIKRPYLS